MEAGGQVPFNDRRLLRSTHYEKGRDKGIALDLKVSIDLAQMTVARARTAYERCAALNNLGNVELAFFVKNRVSKHLDTAQGHADAAHAVFKAAGANHYLVIADTRVDKIATRRAAIT